LARANPQLQHFRSGPETLFVFHGPHTYITPTWYQDSMNVPTWNYAVVHAYAKPRLVEDFDGLHRILNEAVTQFESPRPDPWRFELPEDFKQQLWGAIVGFEARVERIEAKFKLSQNRAPEDYQGVLDGLKASPAEADRRVLELMKRN